MIQTVDKHSLRLQDIMALYRLEEYIRNGLVREQKHPTLPLRIYNYTNKAAIDQVWDVVTNNCRGLITDADGNVIARPFPKFHNLNTSYIPESQESYITENLSGAEPIVTRKMDGSLGILWDYNGEEWGIATRGSFTSDQATWATEWMRKHVAEHNGMHWPLGWTPVFEIIYNANRIVVDYDFEGLVLLALINNQTGMEADRETLEEWGRFNGIKVVDKFDKSVEECTSENNPNEEGYVLSYPRVGQSPLKVKVKFDDYCRLHRVVTNRNPIDVWEQMQDPFNTICLMLADDSYPAHFRDWLTAWSNQLTRDYNAILCEAGYIVKTAKEMLGNALSVNADLADQRKAYAGFFIAQNKRLSPVMFSMLDKKDYSKVIWKLLKPKASDEYRTMEDSAWQSLNNIARTANAY